MQFKDIKQNNPVYILDLDEFRLIQGKATAVSFPHTQRNPKTGEMFMAVDVTIEADGKTADYTIPEHQSVSYAGNLVLSTDKIGLVGDVESAKSRSEQLLASVDKARSIIEKASDLLAELNPELKEKQETEKRFGKIEDSIERMETMMSNFIKKFEN